MSAPNRVSTGAPNSRPGAGCWLWSNPGVRRLYGRMKRRRPATVVVVERYPAVQELLEQTLRDKHARVLVTADPNEALEIARRVEIDIIVVDSKAGDLVREIRALQPPIRVVELAPGRVSLSQVRKVVIGR